MPKNLNLGNFLTISRSNISKLQIFLKNRFHSNWRSYLILTSGQKPKKSLQLFLRKISKCLILGQFGDLFANISKSRFFFKNPALWRFYLYSPLTSCKKSEKSLEPFLRKLRYQPTNCYQQHRSYRNSLTSVQKNMEVLRLKNLKYERYFQQTTLIVYLINTLLFVYITQTSKHRSLWAAI